MSSEIVTFPLAVPLTDVEKQELTRILWQWPLCHGCNFGQPCASTTCPWKRLHRLEPFFQFYSFYTSSYAPDFMGENAPALKSHRELFGILKLLKQNPTVDRQSLTTDHFSSVEDCIRPLDSDQHRAFNLAMRILTMTPCSSENQSVDMIESGSNPMEWRHNESVSQYLSAAFKMRDHPTLNEKDENGKDIKTQLTASNLQKIAGLTFVGTDNLRDHLRLNHASGVVEIFHHTTVLKEHLAAMMEQKSPAPPSPGQISRQLVLETLDSVQKILFPLAPKSRAMLRSLVKKHDLDPDCLRFDSLGRRDDENEIRFQYWGSRLMDLYDEIENPKPRGFLERWMERKSGARYVMMATLAGVTMAVILGVLGLAVSIFQAWVGYQQWKYPAT
ncbi:hypothetical protein LZ32DRAFT_565398 [Colletotrichum eremochloae]|nr:hypothetical protein LZ32DRAFT_565398 [Colletotrichum eremochloae]